MNSLTNLSDINFIQESLLYSFCKKAFSLIKSGDEKEAKKQYPHEYFFIKKYSPSNLEELAQLLSRKLELH